MNFKKDYQELYQFFGGYFPDADLEEITDEVVVSNYVADCSKSEKSRKELEQSKKELSNLIENIEAYWQEFSREANRYFSTSNEALEWLMMIKRELEK